MTILSCLTRLFHLRANTALPPKPVEDIIFANTVIAQSPDQCSIISNDPQTSSSRGNPATENRFPDVSTTISDRTLNGTDLEVPRIAIRRAITPIPIEDPRVPDLSQWDHSSKQPYSDSLALQSSRRNSLESYYDRSQSAGSSKSVQFVKAQLQNARLEFPLRPHTFFVPKDVQQDIITKAVIADDIQAHNTDITHKEAEEYAEKACQDARCLYATLAYIKHGADICALLNEGINDHDMPLLRKPNDRNASLYKRNGDLVKAMTTWTPNHREKFDRVQWWMISPVFEYEGHYSFDEKTVLPFIPLDPKDASLVKKQGGYSEVYPVRIHPAHHKFWKGSGPENAPLVAVKQLFSSDETEFRKESNILKSLGPKNHAYLIKLLATYEMGKKYHLMFPYANANLRKYWEDHPSPAVDKDTVLWSLKQMCGIASGLQLIHAFRATVPLSVPGAGGVGSLDFRLGKGKGLGRLKVEMGEQWFGRHGDIKPENVLWFAEDQCSAHPHPMGVLKIADFGLGRFHGRDSRSGVNPETVVSSPTYEPPECKLRLPVSRAYDMWSLGCIFLEFITWILRGSPAIDAFADFRGREATGTGINDDNFFTIVDEDGILKATVREGVLAWSEQLHADKKCSELLHNLVDLTMSELLVIESEKRSKASWLHAQLKYLLGRAESDPDYLLKPVPRKPVSGRPASLLDTPKIDGKRDSVTFLDQEKPNAAKTQFKLPVMGSNRDLVIPNLGTPVFAREKLHRSNTWPPNPQLYKF